MSPHRLPDGDVASTATPPVALVHDWLTGMRGGERCLEVFADLLPDAPILTLVHEPGSVSERIERHSVRTSALSRLPWLRRHYRKLLPFFPYVTAGLPGDEYAALVSLSHCAAKAVQKRPGARHICYCFTPARYLWDHADTYLDPTRASWPVRLAARSFLPELRAWDRAAAKHVDRFIAISHYVAERIRRLYGRDSEVIYPPVDTERFTIAKGEAVGSHYLMVTALAPYKGVDLAIETFNRLGKPLVIIGRGQHERRLKALAGPTIEFRGWESDDAVARAYSTARAFLLPCEEDFGITPLESMASGRPVIALGLGGACETVVAGRTGSFFGEPTVDSLADAVLRMERDHNSYDPKVLRERAWEFDVANFRRNIEGVLRDERLI